VYQAKVDELERLRSDGRRSELLLIERLDRLSAHLGTLEQALHRHDSQLGELARSMQQVRDLSVQIDQRLSAIGQRESHHDPSSRDAHRAEPGVGLRDPFSRSK
jgi:hypothetical protein